MSEWISVDTRLPEDFQLVLVYGHMDGITIASHADLTWEDESGDELYPSHWMPLPRIPDCDNVD